MHDRTEFNDEGTTEKAGCPHERERERHDAKKHTPTGLTGARHTHTHTQAHTHTRTTMPSGSASLSSSPRPPPPGGRGTTQDPQDRTKPREYNPRWKGYVFIALSSLVSFASITNTPARANPGYPVSIGAFTFSASLIILMMDRLVKEDSAWNVTKAMDGKLEGYILLFFCLWWGVGLGWLTRASGLAYETMNIYFSSWIAWGSCVYTLDQWSAAKDIITIRELTGLSTTLSSWYVLLLSSLVVMVASIDLHQFLKERGHRDDSSFAIALGVFSSILAFFFILVHYKFFDKVKPGGWLELAIAFLLVVSWVIG